MRLLKNSDAQPRTIVTDKLTSYGVALRELMPSTHHYMTKYANNRAERSHETTRFRERGMRRLKSKAQAQYFLSNHAAVSNLFKIRWHLIKASHYRIDREVAFAAWAEAVV